MLESRTRTDVRELTIEAPVQPTQRWRRGYEALTQHPSVRLWRGWSRWGYWPQRIDMRPSRDKCYADVELMDVLLLSEIDPALGREALQRQTETVLFENEMWHAEMTPGDRTSTTRYTQDELLYLLILRELDPAAARARLELLQESPLYDREAGLWIERMDTDETSPDEPSRNRRTGDQLLAAYVRGKEAAARTLHALKNTACDKAGRWLEYVPHGDDRQDILGRERAASEQLLAVLLETLIDPAAARASWQRLRASAFLDAQTGLWRSYLTSTGDPTIVHETYDQLLALYVEAQLEKLPADGEAVAAIPHLLHID